MNITNHPILLQFTIALICGLLGFIIKMIVDYVSRANKIPAWNEEGLKFKTEYKKKWGSLLGATNEDVFYIRLSEVIKMLMEANGMRISAGNLDIEYNSYSKYLPSFKHELQILETIRIAKSDWDMARKLLVDIEQPFKK